MSETFYKLTSEEIIAMKDLSSAEMRILLYLRTIVPFGDRPVNIKIKAIAETLNLNRTTVSRALKKLDQLAYINLELLEVSATINPFSPPSDSVRNRINQCETASADSKSHQAIPNRINRSPEPAPSKGSTSPQTNKTNKTNKKREKATEILNFLESNSSFRDFCLRKAQGLPSVPVLLDSWIVANFEELKGMWAKSQTSSGDQSSAAAVVEAVQKYPQVQAGIDRGELTQDPIFPEGVYDEQGGWWKKADLEGLIHVH